ncbi:MAG: hypothetical protein EA353_02735 [Puniceicoccaceae bacterium]|nr:MAG: hypothetical protein EA353_02735 [Puniceicoccaceae bacterium]
MKPYLAVALSLFIISSASARSPDPSFPTSVEIDGTELTKRGEYRYVYRLFFQLYDAALYAPESATTSDILEAKTPFRLQFRYLREIEKSIILKSAGQMLERNLSASELDQIAERVEQINAAYTTVRDGDKSSLTFQPGVGTTLRIHGEPVVTIEGDDFARLYYQIWLGPKPLSQNLRSALLKE